MVGANTHPGFVLGEIVDSVWAYPAELGNAEVVHAHLLRFPLRPQRPPRVLERPHQFLLLCINGDDRLASVLHLRHLRADV